MFTFPHHAAHPNPAHHLGNMLMNVVRQGTQVRHPVQLRHWLHGDVQELLPHDVLIAAWGDFSLGLIQIDIVANNPAIRIRPTGEYSVMPTVRKLFDWWYSGGRRPTILDARIQEWLGQLLPDAETTALLQRMRTATVHGIKDERGRHDCLYILLGTQAITNPLHGEMLEALLPCIDTAMRQVPQQPAEDHAVGLDLADNQLSGREIQIMEWVRQGKTNYEIGMILNISTFTVKNHMQRILRKLNVTNRAQAASKVESLLRQRDTQRDGRTTQFAPPFVQ